MTRPSRDQGAGSPEDGFTLIEVAIAAVILVVAFSGLGGLLVVNERSRSASADEAVATNTLRQMAERLRACQFEDVAATYDGLSVPVPELAGTCAVTVHTDETLATAAAAALGLPRDLDGDGLATNANVSSDYLLLPVQVTVSWSGSEGNQVRDLHFFLGQE